MLVPGNTQKHINTMNPLLAPFDTPYNIPPFEKIKPEHFIPAIEEGMKVHVVEINNIITNSEVPDFENTIARLEYSGSLLRKVTSVFHNFNSSNTNPQIQSIAREMAPLLSSHYDNITLNEELFNRVKAVYDSKEKLSLNSEQARLLDETFKDFERGGANLDDNARERYRQINSRLSVLTLQFGENVLKETNDYRLLISDENDLTGLPQNLIDQAAEAAELKGYKGQWMFTIHGPSMIPFLQYSGNRTLREQLYKAYVMRGNHNNANDNKEIIKEIVSLRYERAKLLGFESHAAYVLSENMAKEPANVAKLLNQLWTPALNRARQEAAEYQSLINSEGGNFSLQPWDWRYYAEKVRKEKYDLSDDELRPYFSLENVKQGAFSVANALYGIKFKKLEGVPLYHPDAMAYEVSESNGSHLGVLYLDFHPRESKRGGAWMSSYRKQFIDENGNNVRPIVTVVCNFSKATATTPALLTFSEAETFFHEFGHSLHGLLSNSTYYSLSGTSVPRDFVELPSQIMENWAGEPEVLRMYAKHYITGQTIPDSIITKLQKSRVFNQGFETTEYLAAAFLDMAYHDYKGSTITDVDAFEQHFLDSLNLIAEIATRYRSTYFNHIFSGGYSSGYYSYIWAAILDSDAFESFKQNGLFDKSTATSFRRNILERGGTDDPMTLYKKFKGAEPDIKPLLKKRGLLEN
jgi:peptidyl-dipeptidase Dcp